MIKEIREIVETNNIIIRNKMRQTKNKIKSPITDVIEKTGFIYDLTEETGWGETRKADYYRTKDCRHLLCHVESPLGKDAPNIYISDAAMGEMAYDSITPSSGNWIFQGRVDAKELETILKILRIK